MFLTIQEALRQGTEVLDKAGIGVPRLTAEVLLSHALGRDKSFLYGHGSDELKELHWIHYGRYLNERLLGKPTQYIIHKQEFYGREFFVDRRVLIPRPETEHLIDAVLAESIRELRILDVGTGSGAIAVTLALESGQCVLASDISPEALTVAERNRANYRAQVAFFAGDLLDAVQPRSIDLLVSNPPYVPGADAANMQSEVRDWEPHLALFAGGSGLEIYQRLIASAERVVRPGRLLFMELGYRSLDAVREMLAARWSAIRVSSDLAGLPRVIRAELRP